MVVSFPKQSITLQVNPTEGYKVVSVTNRLTPQPGSCIGIKAAEKLMEEANKRHSLLTVIVKGP